MATEAPEKVECESRNVACDGDEGPLGHPRIYLNMGHNDSVQCPYCGRLYVLKAGVRAAADH